MSYSRSNIIKMCTAALAGSILGIVYERMPPLSQWSNTKLVSADSSIVPKSKAFDSVISGKTIDIAKSSENFQLSAKYGLPSSDNLRIFNDYIISYDRKLRSASWVFEHLTPDKLKNRNLSDRSKSNFHEDQAIHEYFRSKLADFQNSGFDRGHLAAAANHKQSQEDMDQTFLLSNISPQVAELNRGAWERLETYVRWRANRAKNVYVVSGPLYLPLRAKDGNLYVTYRVLGNNHVSVPTHYFKVFLSEDNNGKFSLEAFLMPNDKTMDANVKLDDYRVPIDRLDTIERASGVIFFEQLPRNKLDHPARLPEDFRDGPRSEVHKKRISDK